MGLLNFFNKSKKNKNEFDRLNDTCNSIFEDIFNRCRLVFGREMVEVMDIKSKLLEHVKSVNAFAPAQELLAKKILELIAAYFRVIEIYMPIKKGEEPAYKDSQVLDEIEEKMKRVYSLIKTLNSQFYLSSEEITGMSACDDIIKEAEALRNVINDNYIKNKRQSITKEI